MRILFIAKTNLNTDGRILNQLRILESFFPNLRVDFLLLPDKPLTINISNARVKIIRCLFRNNSFLRILTVLEFSVKALFQMIKISPNVIHAQDSSILIPVYIYTFFNRKCTLIYDDHEIPNNFDAKGLGRGIVNIEEKVLKTADVVIFANRERLEFLKSRFLLTNKLTYFLNLAYYDDEGLEKRHLPENISLKLKEIDDMILAGFHLIIHQGVIKKERGSAEIAEFSKTLPKNFKILLVGGSLAGFNQFVAEYNLNRENFLFVGTVDYFCIELFWVRCKASIVLYLPDKLNNRLCAPNRFYLSLKCGIPTIVNRSNPVLSSFVQMFNCGYYIEELNKNTFGDIMAFEKAKIDFAYSEIREAQIASFVTIYKNVLTHHDGKN